MVSAPDAAPLRKKAAQCSDAHPHRQEKIASEIAGSRLRAAPSRLSTKAVDKCVDYKAGERHAGLQKCATVKLVKFSPPNFPLFTQ
jgi:hypothetical protein